MDVKGDEAEEKTDLERDCVVLAVDLEIVTLLVLNEKNVRVSSCGHVCGNHSR